MILINRCCEENDKEYVRKCSECGFTICDDCCGMREWLCESCDDIENLEALESEGE